MTRIERIAPYLQALSNEEFEELLSAAAYTASTATVYDTLSSAEKAEIHAAIARLGNGEGTEYAVLKARLQAKLKSAGA